MGGAFLLDKFAEGNGGSVGSMDSNCLASTVNSFLTCLTSNNRARPMASVMEVGQAACTSVRTSSLSPLMKHPS